MNDSKRNANVYTVLRKKNRARMEEKSPQANNSTKTAIGKAPLRDAQGRITAEPQGPASAPPLGPGRRAPAGRPWLSGGFLKPRLRPGVPPAGTHGVRGRRHRSGPATPPPAGASPGPVAGRVFTGTFARAAFALLTR